MDSLEPEKPNSPLVLHCFSLNHRSRRERERKSETMVKKASWKSIERTPLGDISNAGKLSRDPNKKIQLDRGCGGVFDRLHLVRSKLSDLVDQIDEFFAQSSEHGMKLTTSNEEIESMSNLLSEMHSSLESWVLRLTQSQTTTKTEVQFCKSLQKDHPSTHGGPPRMKYEEPNLDMVISPSPLVAWRAAGCQLLTEKQLFLLTPLSKIKARNPYRKNTNNTLQSIIRNSDSVSETVKELGASNPCFIEEKISMSKTRLKHHSQIDQKKKSNRRKDADEQEEDALEWFLSPPKTCTVMDPNHTSNPSVMAGRSSNCRNPQITTIIDDRNDHESFRGIENQDDCHLQELRLCSLAGKKDSDGGLEWFLSPPKTCAVMEPLRDGKILSTPVVVDGSVIRSRRAGENTLKKELWTRFQAVSMGRILYRESGLQKGGKKGFMDMLEEAT